MPRTRWIIVTGLAASLAAAAYAQPPAEGPPRTRAELQARIAEQFKQADANGDGYVTSAEFKAAREARLAGFAEHREKRRAEHFAMLDTNKDGSLSKEEFLTRPPRGEHADGRGERRWRHGPHGKRMHPGGDMMGSGWFARADANKDGKVSLAEAEAGALAMFDKVDTNHDGAISPAEHDAMRAKWMERREPPRG